MMDDLCPDEFLTPVLDTLRDNDEQGLVELDTLLADYGNDPRLYFLKGSVLAGLQRYEEGRAAMQDAISIAPGYELARFQLGFLEFTSGLAAQAEATWAPFETLGSENPFRSLAQGLNHLGRDEFDEAVRLIRHGMELNTEQPLINGDMALLLEEIGDRSLGDSVSNEESAEPASATHLLLQQSEFKTHGRVTKH